jgi:AcrR family transcriptional regulator
VRPVDGDPLAIEQPPDDLHALFEPFDAGARCIERDHRYTNSQTTWLATAPTDRRMWSPLCSTKPAAKVWLLSPYPIRLRIGSSARPGVREGGSRVGRPAKFSTEQILDTTARLVAEGGPRLATIASIADRLGAPTGSIYHRFDSRDLLLARLWIRIVLRFQEGFVAALAQDDLGEAAVDAALHIPRWSRTNLDDACVMVLYRREELAAQWPAELGGELATLNDSIKAGIRSFVRRRFGSVTKANLDVTMFALVDVPYAAVRRHLLLAKPPPLTVDELVARTCKCILA